MIAENWQTHAVHHIQTFKKFQTKVNNNDLVKERCQLLQLHAGTIHHMVFIYGTHVENDISRRFFHF